MTESYHIMMKVGEESRVGWVGGGGGAIRDAEEAIHSKLSC